MTRLLTLLVLGGAGVLVLPSSASAQFVPRFGVGPGMGMPGPFGPGPGIPGLGGSPFTFVPQYPFARTGFWYNLNTGFSVLPFSAGAGASPFLTNHPTPAGLVAGVYLYSPGTITGSLPQYAQGGAYSTAGANMNPALARGIQRDVAQAQRDAVPGAKSSISGQWNYEKNAEPPAGPPEGADGIPRGPIVPDPDQVVSGDALNRLLAEIVRVEAKGAKGPSAFVTPLLMDDLRFAGPPAADLLNLARLGGSPEYPIAFDDPALADMRIDLAKDFGAVAAVVQTGKSPEAAKVAKLEGTFQKLQNASGAVLKELPFEDAITARRFLNRMANAIKALKAGAATGLIDPKWGEEGLTVAELVKHMTKYKLQFGPAPRGRDESYATMHRHLLTYLVVLTQPKK